MVEKIVNLTTLFKGLFNNDFEKRPSGNYKNARRKIKDSLSYELNLIHITHRSDIENVEIRSTRSNGCITKAIFILKNNKKIIVYCNYENGYYYRIFDSNNKISERNDFNSLEEYITTCFTRQ